ncbi:hypothetical protein Tco_0257634 [Tanacetum coccineum]
MQVAEGKVGPPPDKEVSTLGRPILMHQHSPSLSLSSSFLDLLPIFPPLPSCLGLPLQPNLLFPVHVDWCLPFAASGATRYGVVWNMHDDR